MQNWTEFFEVFSVNTYSIKWEHNFILSARQITQESMRKLWCVENKSNVRIEKIQCDEINGIPARTCDRYKFSSFSLGQVRKMKIYIGRTLLILAWSPRLLLRTSRAQNNFERWPAVLTGQIKPTLARSCHVFDQSKCRLATSRPREFQGRMRVSMGGGGSLWRLTVKNKSFWRLTV